MTEAYLKTVLEPLGALDPFACIYLSDERAGRQTKTDESMFTAAIVFLIQLRLFSFLPLSIGTRSERQTGKRSEEEERKNQDQKTKQKKDNKEKNK